MLTGLVFLFSMYLSPYYIYEDQLTYRDVYEVVKNKDFIDALILYRKHIISTELGHFFIIWLAADYIPKDIFMSAINAGIAYLGAYSLHRIGAHQLVSFVVIFFGYYSWALFLSAERLKVAVFFLLVAFFLQLNGKTKGAWFSYIFSIITHLQSSILIALMILKRYSGEYLRMIFKLKVSRRTLGASVVAVFLAVVIFVVFNSHLLSKISAYHANFGLTEYLRLLAFFVLTVFYSKRDFAAVIVMFSLLFFMVFLVGGMRINIIAYFVFLYYCVKTNRGLNVGFFVTSAYYFLGMIEYISNVIQCGSNNPC